MAAASLPPTKVGGSDSHPNNSPPISIPPTLLQGPSLGSESIIIIASSDPIAALLIHTLEFQAEQANADRELNQAKRAAKWAT